MRLNEYRERVGEMYSDAAYRQANPFLRLLRYYEGRLSQEQIRRLRTRALKGDLSGAYDEMDELLMK